MTRRIADGSIPPSDRSCRGEKQTTRQVPRAGSTRSSGSWDVDGTPDSGSSAGKSLSKTYVPSYGGFTSPLARALPGHR